MTPQSAFHGAEQGVVKKGAALHNHMFAQFCHIFDAQHLVQRIAHNRIAKPCRDVGNLQAVFLGLRDARIHKDRAARAKVCRMRGVQGNIYKFLHAQAKAFGKALKKSPAACGTGLVEAHVADNAVIHLEALHVLAADVYDIADLRH